MTTGFSQTSFPKEFDLDGDERFPSITSDGNTLLFAREQKKGFDFFLSNKVNGKFMPPTQLILPDNMPYPTSPVISHDGRWIYFSAYNKGNNGDIYRMRRWGRRLAKPEILSSKINSRGYELFPSPTKDGKGLYFCRLKDKSEPTNLKYAIYYAAFDKKGNVESVNILPQPINLYSEKEPKIMPDGKTLFFMSKISDDEEEYEVMCAIKNEDESWGEPFPIDALNAQNYAHPPCMDGTNQMAYFTQEGKLAMLHWGHILKTDAPQEEIAKTRNNDTGEDNEEQTETKKQTTRPSISSFSDLGFDIIDFKQPPVYRAIIIGINEYQDDKIANLDRPVDDAAAFEEILTTHYTFPKENVISLKSPTREKIIETLDNVMEVAKENDHILIFYAGHGHWDSKRKAGYWLPSDAKAKSTANWVRNSTIKEYIASYKAKHVLLISDACFSGGIFKTRAAFTDAPKAINNLEKLPSRKAMTSGTLKEVPDESVFVKYLQKRLLENTEKYTSARALFDSFRDAVMNNSENVPQFGVINATGDEGGDFIFVKKDKVEAKEVQNDTSGD
ncbi:hypothetical protein NH26_06740 [Flammeovirga pacifica]|uniref:Peptidase C14 caspase domain-containing protein n=1 Tax=Flammeovirga pacifica TaxID=915059 RepID=A0A1S1YYI6_FLAPC|nr:hypothetical protein NH26_06740 [Flammeovirga pacifica]